jgi:hypothetical protein
MIRKLYILRERILAYIAQERQLRNEYNEFLNWAKDHS